MISSLRFVEDLTEKDFLFLTELFMLFIHKSNKLLKV